jgi:hypothetical protein
VASHPSRKNKNAARVGHPIPVDEREKLRSFDFAQDDKLFVIADNSTIFDEDDE